ncbi:TPA: DUF2913 family protein [Klebsiella pneumoniae]|uniref:DUF2913 family protein n=1 Tax=Klebsiella pneumoniae TaxID=573 RepID=UPI000B952850|nr:DUF2913 family protein [Klebsiella pneumoniae]HCI5985174.1 DUF2913 family protein [Klebsiella quasipneumoniae subsp. quasipneumoniae]EIV7918790.1 DUF2913 family protein [Klebsiella pneumoniae]MBA8323720.1 DUF2913 family protein [Klebsiella pneumoniae]MDK6321963.1 DUF2913 family protein [Klebsiella pneumoniae]NIA42289.1 DUF2913 family protein [Klebsiella pneumoniae]
MKNSVTKNEVPFISSFDAHVSYCLLVAIGIERKYGRVNSHYQQQCFIDDWLKRALDKKLFPVTAKFFLEKMKKQNGSAAQGAEILKNCLSRWNFWQSVILNQSDLVKISYFCEELKQSGWQGNSMTPGEWGTPFNVMSGKHYFTQKQSLRDVFSSSGKLLSPLIFRVKQYDSEFLSLLKNYNFYRIHTAKQSGTTEITIGV